MFRLNDLLKVKEYLSARLRVISTPPQGEDDGVIARVPLEELIARLESRVDSHQGADGRSTSTS